MREEEIKESLQEEEEVRKALAGQQKAELWAKNRKQYINAFQKSLEAALQQFQSNQKKESGKRLKFIYVHCLRTSLEMGTYEYIIRVMDENGFADLDLAEEYYVSQYLKELIEGDKEYFTKLIMKTVIRAKKYEVKDYLRDYIWDTYMKPIPAEIEEVLSKLEELELYQYVEKAETVVVGYGEVLEMLDRCWRFTS